MLSLNCSKMIKFAQIWATILQMASPRPVGCWALRLTLWPALYALVVTNYTMIINWFGGPQYRSTAPSIYFSDLLKDERLRIDHAASVCCWDVEKYGEICSFGCLVRYTEICMNKNKTKKAFNWVQQLTVEHVSECITAAPLQVWTAACVKSYITGL